MFTAHPHAEGEPRQDLTRAGPRAFAAVEGLCAAASSRGPKAPDQPIASDMAHFKLEAEISGLRCSFNAGEELEFRYKSFPLVIVRL
jgi:hypothetical protein